MENVTLSRNNCTPYYDEDIIKTVILNQAISAIAVLAGLFALAIIILFKKWQCFSQRLILYLIVSTTLVSLARTLERVDYNSSAYTGTIKGFCVFVAFLSQNVVWMFLFSITFVTLYLLLTVVSNWHMEKYEHACIFLIFVFPFTFNWVPLVKSTYGRAGAWCWISSIDVDTCEISNYARAYQLVLFYIPITVVVVFEILAYVVILWKLHTLRRRWKTSISNTPEEEVAIKIVRAEVYSLIAYPVIHVLSIVPIVMKQIYGWVIPEQPSLTLWYLSAISIPAPGILFTLTLTLTADTRRRLRWSHLRGAIKNYNTSKLVSEYKVGEMDAVEVSYSRYKDRKI